MQLVLELLSPAGQVLVKLLVLFGLNLVLGLGPEGFHKVDCLPVDGDREVDEVGVLLHDLLDFGLLQELLMRLLYVKNNPGAPIELAVSFLCHLESA